MIPNLLSSKLLFELYFCTIDGRNMHKWNVSAPCWQGCCHARLLLYIWMNRNVEKSVSLYHYFILYKTIEKQLKAQNSDSDSVAIIYLILV